MLIPYNTDAPLYYFPYATIGTIVLNVLLFIPVFCTNDPYASAQDRQLDEPQQQKLEQLRRMLRGEPDTTAEDSPADGSEREDVQLPIGDSDRKRLLELVDKMEPGDSAAKGRKTTVWRLLTVEFGQIRPWQWLTANYMHAGIFHLLGNMFVLWGFGLVVEGKVGWWRFLLIYNLIGVAGWGLVQIIMLFSEAGIGLGASLAIFGILAVALVWAPANDMHCVFMFGIRPVMFEASIMVIAMFAMLLQIAISAYQVIAHSESGFGISLTSEILHLIGAVFGFGVGIVMVQRKLVDCEGWDMYSVWQGTHHKTIQDDRDDVASAIEQIKREERAGRAGEPILAQSLPPRSAGRAGHMPSATPPAVQPFPVSSRHAPTPNADAYPSTYARFHELITAGNGLDAWELLQTTAEQQPAWKVSERDFVKMISSLRNQHLWEPAALAMERYLDLYLERSTTIRLALAQLLLQALNRRQDALRHLESINEALLDDQQRATYNQLVAAASWKS